MRYRICTLLLVILLTVLTGCREAHENEATVPSEETAQSTVSALDADVASMLIDQLSEHDREILRNKNLQDDALKSESLEHKPIIRIYTSLYWELADEPLSKIIEKAEEEDLHQYIWFQDDQNVRLMQYIRNDERILGAGSKHIELNYLHDIRNMAVQTEIMGQKCTVQNIYCFDSYTSYKGAVVYYNTDRGVFIKYYENQTANGVWFTEQEFGQYATAYHRFATSSEQNNSEDGGLLYGTPKSFLEFCGKSDVQSNPTGENEKKSFRAWNLAWIVPAILFVVWDIWELFTWNKKRKLEAEQAERRRL